MINKFTDGSTPLNKATFDPIVDKLNGIPSVYVYRVVAAVTNISYVNGAKIGDLLITGDATSRTILGQTVASIGACVRITSATTGEVLQNASTHASTRIIESIPGLNGKLFIKTVTTGWTTAANQTANFPGNKTGDYVFNAAASATGIFGQSLGSGGLVYITQGSASSITGVGEMMPYIFASTNTLSSGSSTEAPSNMVTIDTAQNISGSKTFSNPATFSNTGNTVNNAAINIEQGGTLRIGKMSGAGGYITFGDNYYVQMYEDSDDILNFKANNGFKFRIGGGTVNGSSGTTERFAINNDGTLGKGTYTYMLPDKTGTIALTSDISNTNLINNLTTTTAGQGALDAAQGSIINTALNNKQDALISGTNIKTINNQSILGSGNISISNGSGGSIIGAKTTTILVGFDSDCDYNVNDYTSGNAAINAAINVLPSTGGKIILREGTYNITGSIIINKSNVTLEGMGTSTILARKADFTNGIIYTTGSCFTIDNLQIHGNKEAYTSSTNYGICVNSTRNTITACYFVNNSYGIYINSAYQNIITGNVFYNSTNYGIYTNGQTNTVTTNLFLNNGSGIYVGNNYNTVTGNTCTTNSSYGIFVTGSYNTVTGNSFSNSSYGINTTGSYNLISSNQVSGNTTGAISNSGTGNYILGNKNNATNNPSGT